MERERPSERISSGSLWAQLRQRARQTEREIIEEFPEWPQWKRRARQWGIVGLLLGLAGVGMWELWGWLSQRAEMQRQRERARIIQVISPMGEVREETVEFVWRPSPIADYYVVEVSDLSYRVIWRSPPIQQVELRLPDPVRRTLQRGERYLWQVRGFTEEGDEVANSFFEEILILR